MNRETQIKTRDAALVRIDNIYKVSKALADQFKTQSVGIMAFKEIVGGQKVSAENNLILEAFNKSVEAIEKTCVDSAIKMESKVIPLSVIKEVVDVSKKAMTSAFEAEKPKKKYVRRSGTAKSKKPVTKRAKK